MTHALALLGDIQAMRGYWYSATQVYHAGVRALRLATAVGSNSQTCHPFAMVLLDRLVAVMMRANLNESAIPHAMAFLSVYKSAPCPGGTQNMATMRAVFGLDWPASLVLVREQCVPAWKDFERWERNMVGRAGTTKQHSMAAGLLQQDWMFAITNLDQRSGGQAAATAVIGAALPEDVSALLGQVYGPDDERREGSGGAGGGAGGGAVAASTGGLTSKTLKPGRIVLCTSKTANEQVVQEGDMLVPAAGSGGAMISGGAAVAAGGAAYDGAKVVDISATHSAWFAVLEDGRLLSWASRGADIGCVLGHVRQCAAGEGVQGVV